VLKNLQRIDFFSNVANLALMDCKKIQSSGLFSCTCQPPKAAPHLG